MVVNSLSCSDSSISIAAQRWLIRALSLNDVVRILEPVLLLLLHPSTQRCSIQSIKENFKAGNYLKKKKKKSLFHLAGYLYSFFFSLLKGDLKILSNRSRSSTKTSGMPADSVATEITSLNFMNIVDRETLWTELDNGPELTKPDSLVASRTESELTEEAEDRVEEEEEEEEESEHTESADTSGAHVSTEDSSSGSALYPNPDDGHLVNGLQRVESECTQASDSLSSDEEDLEVDAMAKFRLLKQEREKREAIDSLFRHVLLYPVAGGWCHLLQGLALLNSLLRSGAECALVDALCTTSLDTSSAAHLNLVSNLLQRHQQVQDGHGFYGSLLSPSSTSVAPSMLIELLLSLCLRFMRSHYPIYLTLGPLDQQGNNEVQVKSVEVLTQIVKQLCFMAQKQGPNEATLELICKLLSGCKVQEYALLTLSASMYVSQRGAEKGQSKCMELMDGERGLSEESLVNFGAGGGPDQYPLQMQLLKLIQDLIILEYHVLPGSAVPASAAAGPHGEPREVPGTPLTREWQTAVLFQQSIKSAQYVQSNPITAQGMFVSAASRALQPQYGYAMHPHWVSLLCTSLPFLGRSLSIIVAPLISQICRNLDELVKLCEHDGGKRDHRYSHKHTHTHNILSEPPPATCV